MSQNKASVPQNEITRVKGLGFLWDKRTPDQFNGRVITRNGKITAKECATVAEAARRFGSGEVAMTTRLTMEIQGVPFERGSRAGDRRNRCQGAPGYRLQGYHLPVWSD